MEYRDFGNADWQVSALGFGAMRLPEEAGEIKEDEAIEMMRHAIDNGVNYIDTAWPYHGGASESLVAKVLENSYREQVKVATKMPSWEIETRDDLDNYLEKQLERLKVETIDFYLLHALNQDHWQNYKDIGLDYLLEWIDKVKREGKIERIGFSFHDDYDLFEKLIDSYDWDFCQIQYNYIDTEFQAGKQGLRYADANDVPVIVMEPLRGGSLAGELPAEIESVFDRSKIKRSNADWALQWLWNQPEVTVVLSGMSTLKQVEENLSSADNSGIGQLTATEEKIVEEVASKYQELEPVNCTGCGYCIPCPVGVKIPDIFALYNDGTIFDSQEEKQGQYDDFGDSERASACVECGQCEEICPQNLSIIDLLTAAEQYLTY
jgi:predicted aldo/keto reductase-like oxidoreductase